MEEEPLFKTRIGREDMNQNLVFFEIRSAMHFEGNATFQPSSGGFAARVTDVTQSSA
jgi:hypothetical protein